MTVLQSMINWQYALVYLDNIITFSQPAEEYIRHTGMALRLLQHAGVAFKSKKEMFLT